MANGLEKRKFQRLQFPIKVTAEVVTVAEQAIGLPALHMQSQNISKTGICLETTTLEIDGVNLLSGPPCARENRLRLKIELIPEESPFTAIGEVRWYDVVRDETGCLYQVGIEFMDIKDQGKDLLGRFLKRHRTTGGFFHKLFG
ncbi:MAG: PilZ domain-containing protein [Proteobacteria bacterium]|nr:PilZ domain-containing protein [Pseudomonadota bacterium]